MRSYLDFEKPVAELEAKLEELRAVGARDGAVSISEEVGRLEVKAAQALAEIYANLTPWQKTQVARHPQRPHFVDYCAGLITEFTPMAGDRNFGEDEAIVGGFGRFRGRRAACWARRRAPPPRRAPAQFRHGPARGLPQGRAPDGARRPLRPAGPGLRRHGRRLPGIEAEERGQAEAIARSTEACLGARRAERRRRHRRGRSGGAIALATANRVMMLEHAIYSGDLPRGRRLDPVARPGPAHDAATAMKITAQDLAAPGHHRHIVPEATGGAHHNRRRDRRRRAARSRRRSPSSKGWAPPRSATGGPPSSSRSGASCEPEQGMVRPGPAPSPLSLAAGLLRSLRRLGGRTRASQGSSTTSRSAPIATWRRC